MKMEDTVLVVEDEAETRDLLARSLRHAGFQVMTASDGIEALEMVRRHHPSIVLLDLMMPGMPGDLVCASIRADPSTAETHIIMLTALGGEQERIAGFELGADDYVAKPFSLRELVLRVSAAARRSRQPRIGIEERDVLHGLVRIDDDAHRVWVKGREVSLTATEYRLLLHLAGRAGKLCTREELLHEVWGTDQPGPRTVDAHVKRLRHKLGAAADAVETVRGSGYRFADEDWTPPVSDRSPVGPPTFRPRRPTDRTQH